jgi:hypothetical protein
MRTDTAKDQGDLVWGGPAISKEIEQPLPQTYYMLEAKHLPAKKIGGRWVMSRAAWRKHIGIPEEVA